MLQSSYWTVPSGTMNQSTTKECSHLSIVNSSFLKSIYIFGQMFRPAANTFVQRSYMPPFCFIPFNCVDPFEPMRWFGASRHSCWGLGGKVVVVVDPRLL